MGSQQDVSVKQGLKWLDIKIKLIIKFVERFGLNLADFPCLKILFPILSLHPAVISSTLNTNVFS